MKGEYNADFNNDFVITKEPIIRELREAKAKVNQQNQTDLGGFLANFLNKLINYL